MSVLQRIGLAGPIEAMIFFEFGLSGQAETLAFQGLSAGKTWRASRIRSASGVLNMTGCSISGMAGRGTRAFSAA